MFDAVVARIAPFRNQWSGVLAAAGLIIAAVVSAAPLTGSATGAVGTPSPNCLGGAAICEQVITQLVATPLASPHPVAGADGRVHLVYELFVTNSTAGVMRLHELQTLDASRHDSVVGTERGRQIIATLGDEDLDGATKPLIPLERGGTLTLGPSQVTRLFLDTTFSRGAVLPRLLEHRFTFTLTPPGGPSSTLSVVSGRTRVIHDSPVVIGPPLAGARWVVAGGCCFPPSYHRTATLPVNGTFYAPERFAIDFVQLLPDHRLYSGPLSDLHSYKYFGAKVLSVAAGVVVGVQDGEPEQTPPHFPANAVPPGGLGNFLMIKIAPGRFAFYAHLQPHSLRVHLGEHVRQGQVIGLLGNTGNSDAPHLHFAVLAGPGPLSSDGLPYEFRSFVSRGTITSPLDNGFFREDKPAVIGAKSRSSHSRELPLANEVIDFPG